MPRLENRPGRRSASRPPRPLVLVVCGADCTEPQYLRGLRDHVANRAVDLKILTKGRAPQQVVDYARKVRDNSERDFDKVWCVIDVDEFDIDVAEVAARAARIDLAVSNPCFELWLLLHHEDCRTHLPSYDSVCLRLRKYVPRYDKTELDFADYVSGVDVAVDPAKRLEPDGTSYGSNPSTNVWKLVELIRGTP
ncbi:MAG: RloB domain-containing protein [Micromonosporaceae bacterium]|nr:RloB domain-containing protein [Micromonosporaceae bacterium]